MTAEPQAVIILWSNAFGTIDSPGDESDCFSGDLGNQHRQFIKYLKIRGKIN